MNEQHKQQLSKLLKVYPLSEILAESSKICYNIAKETLNNKKKLHFLFSGNELFCLKQEIEERENKF